MSDAHVKRLNVLYESNWTRLVHEQLRKFESRVVAAAKMDGYEGKDLTDSDLQWSFSGALLYSVTVITTIGYGNLAPKTAAGKVATMVYAIVGVPLMLLCLSNLGALLADTFQFAYSQAHACLVVVLEQVRQLLTECAEYQVSQAGGGAPDAAATRLLRELRRPAPAPGADDDDDDDEDDEEERSAAAHDTPSRVPLIWRPTEQQHQVKPKTHTPPRPFSSATAPLQSRVPVWLVLVVLTGYICLGAAIFARWEDWSFLDGAYFCFITLSTIGFGDLVPGKSLRTFQQRAELQLVACCAYLLLGLVLIAMSFSLVQAEVVARCRQAAASLGLLKR
ncbi:TWiK family of potassium channels protein 7-like [Schistocerca gregaria]|uniref:TWiK family of potassium channels protein 7-like n=1 Tax=Schistocerca gregaria TaxID=7010 RepID=UPI00211E7B23|nr:TWiK family of potassium channels protein 7-like [Schistocerca gregaria]